MSYLVNMAAARVQHRIVSRDRRAQSVVVECGFPPVNKPISPCAATTGGATLEAALRQGRGGRKAVSTLVQPDFLNHGLENLLGLSQLVRLAALITPADVKAAAGNVQRKTGSFGTHIAGVYDPPLLDQVKSYDSPDACMGDIRRVMRFLLSHCSPLSGFAHMSLLEDDLDTVVTVVIQHGLGIADNVINDEAVGLLVRMSLVVAVFSSLQLLHPKDAVHGIPTAIQELQGFSYILWLLDPASPVVAVATPTSGSGSTSQPTKASTPPPTSAMTSVATPASDPALLAMLQALQNEVARLNAQQTVTLPPAVAASAASVVVPALAVPGANVANPLLLPRAPVVSASPHVLPSSLSMVQSFSPALISDARVGTLPTIRTLVGSATRSTLVPAAGGRQSIKLGSDGRFVVDTSETSLPVTNIAQLRTAAEQMARLMTAIGRTDIANSLREHFVGNTLATLERVSTFATSLTYVRGTFDALGTFIKQSNPGHFSFKFDLELHVASNSEALADFHQRRDVDGQPTMQRPRSDVPFFSPPSMQRPRTDGHGFQQHRQPGGAFLGPPPTGPPPTLPNPTQLPARAPPPPFAVSAGVRLAPCSNYASNRPCAYFPCPFSH